MKKLLLLFIVLVLLSGCGALTKEEIIKNYDYIIVDVREKNEYESGHIKDALNVPLNKVDEYNFDKDKYILLYCASGTRSEKAYNVLKSKGYSVYNLGAYEKINMEKE